MEVNINGQKISYKTKGEGQPIVFLHGWGQNKESFDKSYDKFSQNFNVWALDLPGFGASGEPKDSYTIYDYNIILVEFIAVFKLQNPTLICHSFGGRIGIIYAANNSNLNRLIITGGAGIKPKKKMGDRFRVGHYKFMKFLCSTPFYYQHRDDLLATSGSSDYKKASPIMKQVLIKTVNEDLSYLLEEIEVPTLLYWGEDDDATPVQDAVLMERFIGNSKLIAVKGMGHFAYLENHEDFNEKVLQFIS